MRLQSITIEGFRAFAQEVTLDLDADVILLQGPNGVGKTSLLDAILWALAGRIARFEDRGSPVSLYAREGLARVALTLSGSKGDVTVIRASDGGKTSVRLSAAGDEVEGATAEQHLCNLLLPHLADRAGAQNALGNVLTRGVYLQQDLVRQFIEGDTAAERFALVSEVIGAGAVLEVQQALEKSRNSWSRATSNFRKEEIDPFQARISQLDEQLARLAEGGVIQSADARVSSETLFGRALALLGQSRFNSGEPPTTAGRLDRFLKELAAERARLERQVATAETLKDQLGELDIAAADDGGKVASFEQEEVGLVADLAKAEDEIRVEIDRIAAERERQVAAADRAGRAAAMAKLALEGLGEHCPVCEQEHDIEHTIRHLHTLIDAAAQPQAELQPEDRLTRLNQARAALHQKLEHLRNAYNDHRRSQRERESRQAHLRARLQDFGIEPTASAPANLSDVMDVARATLRKLDFLIADGEKLSLGVLRLGEQRRREELTAERVALSGRLSIAMARAAAQDRTHALAGRIIEELRDASLTVTKRQIEQIAPLFQRIYSRIDPHPTFRVTQMLAGMERGRGRLNVGVQDPDINTRLHDASPLLSSSQLNSFAVSLFLAMNLALPTLKLGVTILDDPLQSLDSINLLGLVDVLRRFRAHRQIIVSTHEDRLLGLLQRKLRPVREGERLATIVFDDWSREGPSLRSSCAEFSRETREVLAA